MAQREREGIVASPFETRSGGHELLMGLLVETRRRFIADLFRELLFWSCPFKSRWNACSGDCMYIYLHNLNLCWTRYIVAGHVSFQVQHAYSLQPPMLERTTGEGEAIMKSSMLSKAF
jgi:hypothetical protein